jgi:putative ABC transport system ATP-binding protein
MADGASEHGHQAIISLTGVWKGYARGSEVTSVLEDVDLQIAPGAFEAIMGPSGSGKSTLLNLIGGVDRASKGTVEVAGVDITNRTEDELATFRLRNIGFVFQFYNLVQVLTAFQNVELPMLLMGLGAAERRRRVETALGLVGLGERLDHFPRQLSAGQEQRVAIARAIVTDPSIIVADEPTGDLDRKSADEVLKLLTILNKKFNKTILMVTHDPEAARAAQTIRRLDKGQFLSVERTT